MDDATGLAEALLGLDGFAVLAVEETSSEVIGLFALNWGT
jgi:hypothetical protein